MTFRFTKLVPVRAALFVGLSALAVAAAAPANRVQAANAAGGSFTETMPGHDFSGIWMLQHYVASSAPLDRRILRDVNGQLAPTQPWAKKLYDDRIASEKTGHTYAAPKTLCLPDGLPLMWWAAPFPVQIIQTSNEVIFLHELMRQFRIAYIGKPHQQDEAPSYYGDSVAHWEGDTLVIDTTNFNGKNVYDMLGLPESDQAHITERITRPDHNHLHVVVTMEDPKVFTKPWQRAVDYELHPDDRVQEYICLDGNRNLVVNGGTVTVDGKGGVPKPTDLPDIK